MGVVYLVICDANGKCYAGKTVGDLDGRKNRHEYDAAKGSPFPFHRALMKYGFSRFTWETIHLCDDDEELCRLEVSLIREADCKLPNGYNVTDGGDGFRGMPKSAEHRKKIGDASRGRTASEETRRKISAAMTGKSSWRLGRPLTEVHKKHLSEACIGRKLSDDAKEKLSKAFKGRVSPNKGKSMSEETKLKISLAQKGRKKKPFTDAHRAAIAAAARKRNR